LKALGLKEKLVAVPAPDVIKYTYASAAAFRQWLSNSDLNLESINLYTFDVHTVVGAGCYLKKYLVPQSKLV